MIEEQKEGWHSGQKEERKDRKDRRTRNFDKHYKPSKPPVRAGAGAIKADFAKKKLDPDLNNVNKLLKCTL